MPRRRPTSETLTSKLQGRQISAAVFNDDNRQLTLHFSGGILLVIDSGSSDMKVCIEQAPPSEPAGKHTTRPTKRQLEYLSFIDKYIQRFGGAPAEADIARHFLVSAPTVNQMIQMLERQRFITRQNGVPRSIRICIDLGASSSTK